MKLLLAFLAALQLGSVTAFAGSLMEKPNLEEDFTAKGPMECWTIADGVLTGKNIASKQGSILWTKKSYKDFTIEGEFRFSGEIDSGIFLRCECDQIQIGVSRSLKKDMTGSPYIDKTHKYPVEADVKGVLKEGDWNAFSITAKGAHYLVSLNGKQVLDYTSETSVPEGPIGFQVHPGVEMKVEFRKLAVKEEEASK